MILGMLLGEEQMYIYICIERERESEKICRYRTCAPEVRQGRGRLSRAPLCEPGVAQRAARGRYSMLKL